ncbi:hypothetical protein JL720_13994 [Aureococcus anophagefferens]|nr:hypothetical protein JL720_13994 [Aureococcus anophagefferens]
METQTPNGAAALQQSSTLAALGSDAVDSLDADGREGALSAARTVSAARPAPAPLAPATPPAAARTATSSTPSTPSRSAASAARSGEAPTEVASAEVSAASGVVEVARRAAAARRAGAAGVDLGGGEPVEATLAELNVELHGARLSTPTVRFEVMGSAGGGDFFIVLPHEPPLDLDAAAAALIRADCGNATDVAAAQAAADAPAAPAPTSRRSARRAPPPTTTTPSTTTRSSRSSRRRRPAPSRSTARAPRRRAATATPRRRGAPATPRRGPLRTRRRCAAALAEEPADYGSAADVATSYFASAFKAGATTQVITQNLLLIYTYATMAGICAAALWGGADARDAAGAAAARAAHAARLATTTPGERLVGVAPGTPVDGGRAHSLSTRRCGVRDDGVDLRRRGKMCMFIDPPEVVEPGLDRCQLAPPGSAAITMRRVVLIFAACAIALPCQFLFELVFIRYACAPLKKAGDDDDDGEAYEDEDEARERREDGGLRVAGDVLLHRLGCRDPLTDDGDGDEGNALLSKKTLEVVLDAIDALDYHDRRERADLEWLLRKLERRWRCHPSARDWKEAFVAKTAHVLETNMRVAAQWNARLAAVDDPAVKCRLCYQLLRYELLGKFERKIFELELAADGSSRPARDAQAHRAARDAVPAGKKMTLAWWWFTMFFIFFNVFTVEPLRIFLMRVTLPSFITPKVLQAFDPTRFGSTSDAASVEARTCSTRRARAGLQGRRRLRAAPGRLRAVAGHRAYLDERRPVGAALAPRAGRGSSSALSDWSRQGVGDQVAHWRHQVRDVAVGSVDAMVASSAKHGDGNRAYRESHPLWGGRSIAALRAEFEFHPPYHYFLLMALTATLVVIPNDMRDLVLKELAAAKHARADAAADLYDGHDLDAHEVELVREFEKERELDAFEPDSDSDWDEEGKEADAASRGDDDRFEDGARRPVFFIREMRAFGLSN